MDDGEHSKIILPVCVEIFKRLEDKVDTLLERTDRINDKFEEVSILREKVAAHESKFVEIDTHRRWFIGMQITTLLCIAIQVGTFLYMWGSLNKQVEINTERWDRVLSDNPVDLTKGNLR